jgi:hypothetical protein
MSQSTTTAHARQGYEDYLRRFGVAARSDRVMTMRDLDLNGLRFFAYHDDHGVRLKAAISPAGWVSAGHDADDDWFGLLSSSTDAAGIAGRIAWLETNESHGPHGPSTQATIVVGASHPPIARIDPQQWAMVEAPTLHAGADGTLTLNTWLLEAGVELVRWTVMARRGVPARIERLTAEALLVDHQGDAAPDSITRAVALLATGSEIERTWALQAIADAGHVAAAREVAAVLVDTGASADLRSFSAATLARLGADSAIGPLGRVLHDDAAAQVRVACAQSLARLHGVQAVDALSGAAEDEADEGVRIEIVHALSAQGPSAHDALKRISERDAAPRVRELAGGYLEPMR